jgi:hypothetical protein
LASGQDHAKSEVRSQNAQVKALDGIDPAQAERFHFFNLTSDFCLGFDF